MAQVGLLRAERTGAFDGGGVHWMLWGAGLAVGLAAVTGPRPAEPPARITTTQVVRGVPIALYTYYPMPNGYAIRPETFMVIRHADGEELADDYAAAVLLCAWAHMGMTDNDMYTLLVDRWRNILEGR